MNYKIVSYKDINKDKWAKLLMNLSPLESQYSSYWYISSVSGDWSAFVLGDYVAAFPFAHTKKKGYKLIYQPFFTRCFSFLGELNNDFITCVFEYFKENFSHLDINLFNEIDSPYLTKKKLVFQQLNLINDYSKIKDSFSKNTVRILKKNQNLKINKSLNLDLFISLFKETVGEKINYKIENYNALISLIKNGLRNNTMEFLQIENNDEVLAYGVFYSHGNVINFLKGAATKQGKKMGAMYILINHIIAENCNSDKVFDFGGSNVDTVSGFYKKFGAKDVVYYNYSFDNLPKLIKKLKNIRDTLLK